MLFWRILYEENRFWGSFLMSVKKMGCKTDGDEHTIYIILFDAVVCGLSNGFRCRESCPEPRVRQKTLLPRIK